MSEKLKGFISNTRDSNNNHRLLLFPASHTFIKAIARITSYIRLLGTGDATFLHLLIVAYMCIGELPLPFKQNSYAQKGKNQCKHQTANYQEFNKHEVYDVNSTFKDTHHLLLLIKQLA